MLWRPLQFSRGPKAQGKIVTVSRTPRGNRFNHPPNIEQSIFVLYHDITWFLFCHVIVKTNTWLKSLQSWYNKVYFPYSWWEFLVHVAVESYGQRTYNRECSLSTVSCVMLWRAYLVGSQNMEVYIFEKLQDVC